MADPALPYNYFNLQRLPPLFSITSFLYLLLKSSFSFEILSINPLFVHRQTPSRSSAVSDTCSNSIRVVKVYKQSAQESVSYPQAIKEVLAKGGIRDLMFRGLETKILANGLQGILFSILWKQFEEILFKVSFLLAQDVSIETVVPIVYSNRQN